MPWPSNNIAPDSLSASHGWRYTCGTVQPDSGATYSYDAIGNRTDHSAVIAPGNRLVKFNGDTIAYDDDGNITRRYNPVTGANHRYVWNALGQLDTAIVIGTSPSSTVVEHYSYDASGRLVHIHHGDMIGGTLVFSDPSQNWRVYQGSQISALIGSSTYYTDLAYDDGTDRPALEYIHGPPSDEWHTQLVDVMGNVAGSVVKDTLGVPYTWDVWGRNTSPVWDGTEVLGWKGLLPQNATGLVYMRSRWYDPALGRFLSEDPIGLGGGLNQYAFAGNDPVNASDPMGLSQESCYGYVDNQGVHTVCEASPPSGGSMYLNPLTWIDPREPADPPPLQSFPSGPGGMSAANAQKVFAGVAQRVQPFQKLVNCGASVAALGISGVLDISGAGEIYEGVMGAKVAVVTIGAVSFATVRGSVTLASVRMSTVRVAADATAVRNIDIDMVKGAAFDGSVSIVAQDRAPFWSYLPGGGTIYAGKTAYQTCKH